MRDDAEVGGRRLWRPSPASLERGPISPCPCEAEWPVGKPRAQAPDRRGFGCWPTPHCQREPGGDSPSHAFTSPSEEWADSASIRGLWAVRGSPALGQILWRLGFSSPQAALGYLSVPLAAVSPSKQRRGDSLSHLFQTASSGIIYKGLASFARGQKPRCPSAASFPKLSVCTRQDASEEVGKVGGRVG